MSEEFLQQTFDARTTYLRQMGEVDDMLLAPLINPAFMGGPAWPSFRQSWRVVRNGKRTIVVSDGLSDPFEDQAEPSVGFGLEVLGETADPLPGELQASWLFSVVYAISQQVAGHGGLRELVDELGLLSMEIDAPSGLQSVANDNGMVGVLMGLRPPKMPIDWDLPAGLVKVLTVKVLHPDELDYVAEEYEVGRDRLKELFVADGSYHRSSLTRPPAV